MNSRLPVLLPLFGVVSCALLQAHSYEDLFRQAEQLSVRRDYAGAIQKYKDALKLRPGAPEAMSNLGVMYHAVGQYLAAVKTLTEVVRTNPDVFPAQLILGLSLVRLNRAPDAVPHLKAALQLSPGNREAGLALAAAFVAINELPEAARLYEEQSGLAPSDAEALYGLGICYERMAEAASRRLSKLPGGTALDKKFLSEYLLERGEIRLAEEALRDTTAFQKEEPSSDAKQAYAEARLLATKSRDAFAQLLQTAPESWQSKLFTADVNRQQRQFQDAIANYEVVQRVQPDNPAPVVGLATVYWELGQFEKSEEYLKRALQLNPASAQALYALANIRVRQHREEDSIPLLKAYLAVDPDSLSACADLGRAYFHLGRNQEAAVYLERARPIDDKGEIHYQLATVLKRLNRKEESDAALRQSTLLRNRQIEREQRLHSGHNRNGSASDRP